MDYGWGWFRRALEITIGQYLEEQRELVLLMRLAMWGGKDDLERFFRWRRS